MTMEPVAAPESHVRVAGNLMQACNFRDMGGVPNRDGMFVRRGIVFRSASLFGLAPEHVRSLRELGIVQVIDLRSDVERVRQPSGVDFDTWSRPHDRSEGDLIEALKRPDLTPSHTTDFMKAVYRKLPEEQAESYGELFRRISDGALPILFHCSAGKDRTGIAAALLLALLDVPREAITAEYLLSRANLTDSVANIRGALLEVGVPLLDDRLLKPILDVQPSYLDAMFAAVEKDHGSVRIFAERHLGLDQARVSALRQRLLQPEPSDLLPQHDRLVAPTIKQNTPRDGARSQSHKKQYSTGETS